MLDPFFVDNTSLKDLSFKYTLFDFLYVPTVKITGFSSISELKSMKIRPRGILFTKLAVLSLFFVGVLALVLSSSASLERVSASADGPTVPVTSAPPEVNCTSCHSNFPVNSGEGSVTFINVPPVWRPGQQYPITVKVTQADAVYFGFQMTVIDGTGAGAGTYTLPSETTPRSQIQTFANNRTYVAHTDGGLFLPNVFGHNQWTFTWTAPATYKGKVTFYASGNAANSDGSTNGDYIYTTNTSSVAAAPVFDLDGDQKTDVAIFRPNGASSEWWWLRSSNGGNAAVVFGANTDTIVPADYTGDGKTDVAFWRPSNGNWFVLRSEDLTFFAAPFGANGDTPVPGDYDADGRADFAVFRPMTLNWFINKSSGGTDIFTFGAAGDKPVPGDFDGDGKSDIAIYRPNGGSGSEWWIRRSSTGAVFATQFGSPTDKTVPGDYTGDGKTDIAFWRPSNGNWFILRSEDLSFFAFPFGANGDTAVPGDYDGDGRWDAGVFRPTNSTWFVQRSTAGTLIQQFGITNDIPLPSAYVR